MEVTDRDDVDADLLAPDKARARCHTIGSRDSIKRRHH
jgi:hypothetical protein